MASTNQTPHYNLPQFLSSDKPSWLGDINPAFLDIDTQLFSLASDASDASSSAAAAQQSAQASQTAAELAQTQAQTAAENVAKLDTKVTSLEQSYTGLAAQQNTQGSEINVLKSDVDTLQTDVQSAQTTANAAQTAASNAQSTATSAQSAAQAATNNVTTLTARLNKIDTQSIIVPGDLFSAWPIFLRISYDSTKLYAVLLGQFIGQGNILGNLNGPYATLTMSFTLPNLNFPFANTLVDVITNSSGCNISTIQPLTVSGSALTFGSAINSTITKSATLSGSRLTITLSPTYNTNPVPTNLYRITTW